MNIAQKLKELLDIRGMSRSRLAREIGVHTSTVSNWLDGKDVKSENLATLCAFFNCSLDYLTGATSEAQEKTPTLTEKDERDIEKRLESVLEDLENGQGDLAFSGEALDDETRELLIKSLRNSMEVGKALAKKKYTPKKYRKD